MRSATTLLLGILLAAAGVRPLRAADENDAGSQAAVRQALGFLKSDMRVWRDTRGCAACHHGPFYVWAATAASRQGYRVDESDVRETGRWLAADDRARIFPASKDDGESRWSQATVFLGLALNALPHNDATRVDGWARIARHWNATQADDGSWHGPSGRPPIFNTPQIVTRLAAIALAERGTSTLHHGKQSTGDVAEQFSRLRERTERYNANSAPDDSHQGLVLRLWDEVASGRVNQPKITELLRELRDRQQFDGGWSQASPLSSDAFATGQTLFVMQRVGVSKSDVNVQRGLAFLEKTQQPDGTWTMVSRPEPETGKPARNLNPITYAAAAWAVLGMSAYVPETSAAPANEGTAVPADKRDERATVVAGPYACPAGQCPGR
jgi:hypothetical protein